MTWAQIAEKIRAILDMEPEGRRAKLEALALELEILQRRAVERG